MLLSSSVLPVYVREFMGHGFEAVICLSDNAVSHPNVTPYRDMFLRIARCNRVPVFVVCGT